MKRYFVAVTALIAALAIGMATVSTTTAATDGHHVAQVAKKKKKKKRFPSGISLTIVVTQPSTYSPGSTTFSGQVTSGKPACVAGRTVNITRNGALFTSTATTANGSY